MKRQRAKQRPLYRYDVYRGRRRGQARLIGAAGCAVFGLLLVLIRSLGIRFSGFLLLGLAALLVLSWLLDRLAAGNHRWRLIHRGFYGCLTVGLAALLGLEVFIINRGRSDMTPLPADAVIVLGAGVNGTEPSLSLRTRLDKAVDYLERWPDIPAVLTGGTGYDDVICFAPVRPVVEQADAILGFDGCLNFFAGPTDSNFKAEFNFYNVHYLYTHVVGTSGGNTSDMKEAIEMMTSGRINPATMLTHIGGLNAVVDTTLNLPNIKGGKKLIYTQIELPLTAIADFEKLGESDPLFAKLAEITARHNGLWSPEAEKYLLQAKA